MAGPGSAPGDVVRLTAAAGACRAPGGGAVVIEAGSRRRNQPAPPRILFEALTTPNRDPARRWLRLRRDEVWPEVQETDEPSLVVWSSLWAGRPEALIRFDLALEGAGYGTDLRWTLLVAEPLPDAPLLGHLRKRLDQLINAELRYSFGQ